MGPGLKVVSRYQRNEEAEKKESQYTQEASGKGSTQ